MVASDGEIPVFGQGRPHPRSYGTFVRVLGTYVREKGLLSLEEAVRKMTSLPALRVGLVDRGLVRRALDLESGAILFGIRIHRARLDAVAREAGGARALLDAIATMHPAMQRYKSLLPIRDAVVAHLESRLAASGEGAC